MQIFVMRESNSESEFLKNAGVQSVYLAQFRAQIVTGNLPVLRG